MSPRYKEWILVRTGGPEEINYIILSQKSFVFFMHIIYEPQEFPLEQLWYHDAVLFRSPAALILKRVSKSDY
jgi:hypothetical protein